MEDIYRNEVCSWINKMLNVIIIGRILKCQILLGVTENAEKHSHVLFWSVFPSGHWEYSSRRLSRVPGKVSRWGGGKSRVHWGVFKDHHFSWMTSNKYHSQTLPISPGVKLKPHTTKSVSRWRHIGFDGNLEIGCRCVFYVRLLLFFIWDVKWPPRQCHKQPLHAWHSAFTSWWVKCNTPRELRKRMVMAGLHEVRTVGPLNRLAEAG